MGHVQGWPEPYAHTVYDGAHVKSPAKNTVYTYVFMVLANHRYEQASPS